MSNIVRYMSADVPEYQGNMGRKSGFSSRGSSSSSSIALSKLQIHPRLCAAIGRLKLTQGNSGKQHIKDGCSTIARLGH